MTTPSTTTRVKLHIPSKKQLAGRRGPRYVSSATQGVGISAYLAIGSEPAAPQFAGAIGAPYCTTNTTDGSQDCSFPVAAPIGNDYFDVTLYDQPPTAGGVPQGNALSRKLRAPGTVTTNATNAVSLTLDGIVAQVGLTGGVWTATANQVQFSANVVTFDAAGQVIIGDPYDTPVTLSVSGAGAPDLSFLHGQTLTSPSDNQLVLAWNGQAFSGATSIDGAGTAIALPSPNTSALIPFIIPAASLGDLLASTNANSSYGDNGATIVHAGASTDDESENNWDFLYTFNNPTTHTGIAAPTLGTVLSDGTVVEGYITNAMIGAAYYDTLEIDMFPNDGGTPWTYSNAETAVTHALTDLCQLNGLTSNGGNVSALGTLATGAQETNDSGSICGATAGTSLLAAKARHALGHRHVAASQRTALGRRRTKGTAGAFSVSGYAIETYSNIRTLDASSVLASSATVLSSSLLANAVGLAQDGVGRFYVPIAGSPLNMLAVYDVGNTNGDKPTLSVPLAATPLAAAVNVAGDIAVLESTGSAYQLEYFGPYPTATKFATVTVDASLTAPGTLAFDRFGNLWVGGQTQLRALPPIPIAPPSPYSPSFGASVTMQSTPTSLSAFSRAVGPTGSTPSPSPGPSSSP